MRLFERTFTTMAEVEAFVEGIELVGDTNLGVCGPHSHKDGFVVYVHDWAGNDGDVCPACRAGGEE